MAPTTTPINHRALLRKASARSTSTHHGLEHQVYSFNPQPGSEGSFAVKYAGSAGTHVALATTPLDSSAAATFEEQYVQGARSWQSNTSTNFAKNALDGAKLGRRAATSKVVKKTWAALSAEQRKKRNKPLVAGGAQWAKNNIKMGTGKGKVMYLPTAGGVFKKYVRASTPQRARLLIRDRNGVTKLGPTDDKVVRIYGPKITKNRGCVVAHVTLNLCKKIKSFAGKVVAKISVSKGLVTVDLK